MTIDTVFHDLSNETKAARICENHGASNKYECDFFLLQEIRDSINNVKREFSQTAQQIASTPCPSGGCVSTTVLVALLGVQLLILISFMMYR